MYACNLSHRWAGCAGTAAWCRTCCRYSTRQPSEQRFPWRQRWTGPLWRYPCLRGRLWRQQTRMLFKLSQSSAPSQRFFELHLHVRIAFKWVVSSFLSRSRMCGGGAAAGACWALISCSDCRVLWELLSGNTSSRQRAARPAMWVIHRYTYQCKLRCINIILMRRISAGV